MTAIRYFDASVVRFDGHSNQLSTPTIHVAICERDETGEYLIDPEIESADFEPKADAISWLMARGCVATEAERVVLQAVSGELLNQSDGYSIAGSELYLRLKKA